MFNALTIVNSTVLYVGKFLREKFIKFINTHINCTYVR